MARPPSSLREKLSEGMFMRCILAFLLGSPLLTTCSCSFIPAIIECECDSNVACIKLICLFSDVFFLVRTFELDVRLWLAMGDMDSWEEVVEWPSLWMVSRIFCRAEGILLCVFRLSRACFLIDSYSSTNVSCLVEWLTPCLGSTETESKFNFYCRELSIVAKREGEPGCKLSVF